MSTSSSSDHAFERDFCSNFTCCGKSLADLHTLLDHFEEAHVFVLGSNGRPLYPTLPPFDDLHHLNPPPSSSDCSLSTRSTSYVFDYPHTPSQPPRFASNHDHNPIRYPADIHDMFDVTEGAMWMSSATIADFEFDFDFRKSQLWEPFPDDDDDDDERAQRCYSSSPTSDGPEIDADEEEKFDFVSSIAEMPSLSSVHQNMIPDSGSPQRTHDLPSEHDVFMVSQQNQHSDLSDRPVFSHPPLDSSVSPKPTVSKQMISSRSRRGTREKTFKCPRAGCTKSYLNPNGLKYHLEKGTCEIVSKGRKD